MNYEQAIDYIHSVNWTFCKPGLERIRVLCEALGNPQDKLTFIHVAGTNGKGSFCAMMDAVLRAEGYRVGLFTSPYITCFNERMRVNGENISDEELIELVERIRPIADAMQDKPTEFELITALAFLYFAKQKCEVVILECGLGGRLDATNIIKRPLLSVITGIALDHTAILGDTVEQIATEKAGIIKKGSPPLWCGDNAEAEHVIRTHAVQTGAPMLTVSKEHLTVHCMTLDGTDFDFGDHKDLHIPLLGTYQPLNAANVLSAIDLLRRMDVLISEEAVRKGLADVAWPARFEIIQRDPLIIADGGHNPEGIDSAVDSIRAYFGTQKVSIVTGVMADKDYRYMAKRIASVADAVFCLTPDNPRALSAEQYAAVFEECGVSATAAHTVKQAISCALTHAAQTNTPIVCLGSLYMYGEIRQAIKKFK
jgi:dihydrofolate synthase/folylpolyglutamate synthase